MSILKTIVVTENSNEVFDFLYKFDRLNKNLKFNSENRSNCFISGEYVDKFVIPDNYSVGKSRNTSKVYVTNKSNDKLFELYYYPYADKNNYNQAQVLKVLDKNNFYTENEYYLEEASKITAAKYNINFLKSAMNAKKNGNPDGFTRDNNARFMMSKVPNEQIVTIMRNILEKQDNYSEAVRMSNEIEDLYYSYINEIIKKKKNYN